MFYLLGYINYEIELVNMLSKVFKPPETQKMNDSDSDSSNDSNDIMFLINFAKNNLNVKIKDLP